jgi:membrane protein
MPETLDPGRLGTDAAHPAAIPDIGWWAILKRVWRASSEKALWVAAGGVAFFAFFALIPMLGVLVLTYGQFVGSDDVQARMQDLGSVFPDEAMRSMFGQLLGTARGAGSQFGWGLVGSLGMLLWSVLFASRALMAGLNHAYHESETRGFFALNALALLLGLGSLGLMVGLAGMLTAGPVLFSDAVLGPFWGRVVRIGRWPFLGVILVLALIVCYRLGPCRAAPKWRWVSGGAVAGATLWMLASLGFSFYVRRIVQYEAAYGLAGAVLTLMIWLYLLAYAVLLGATLNAETERQTSLDTTVGPDRPIGARDAKAADRKPR